MEGADTRQRFARAGIGRVGIRRIFRSDGEAGVVAFEISGQEGIGRVDVADIRQA